MRAALIFGRVVGGSVGQLFSNADKIVAAVSLVNVIAHSVFTIVVLDALDVLGPARS